MKQKKTSGEREELRQLSSSLITTKEIQMPVEFDRLVNATSGKTIFQFTA